MKKREEEYENKMREARDKLAEIERTKQAAHLLAKNLSNALNLLEETTKKVHILEEKTVPALEGQVQSLQSAMEEVKQQQQQNGNNGNNK